MTNTWPGWENAGLIGEGSFGKVYRIRREEFGKTYEAALKVITIPSSQADLRTAFEEGMDEESVTSYFRSFVEDIVAEFALMSELKGKSNIVSYEDHMIVEHEDAIGWDILIRMELLTALPDYAAKNPLKETDVIRLGQHLSQALALCRKRGIVHRDIKPENIFVSKDGDFKLGDFGVARVAEKTISAMSRKGTYNYMAPEVYRGEEYGYAADLYSLGLVLYRFLNDNRTPFLPPYPQPIQYSDKEKALNRRIGGESLPPPSHGSRELQEVVLKACAFRPEERYGSADELREALTGLLTGAAVPAFADRQVGTAKQNISYDSRRKTEESREQETAREEVSEKKASALKQQKPLKNRKIDWYQNGWVGVIAALAEIFFVIGLRNIPAIRDRLNQLRFDSGQSDAEQILIVNLRCILVYLLMELAFYLWKALWQKNTKKQLLAGAGYALLLIALFWYSAEAWYVLVHMGGYAAILCPIILFLIDWRGWQYRKCGRTGAGIGWQRAAHYLSAFGGLLLASFLAFLWYDLCMEFGVGQGNMRMWELLRGEKNLRFCGSIILDNIVFLVLIAGSFIAAAIINRKFPK